MHSCQRSPQRQSFAPQVLLLQLIRLGGGRGRLEGSTGNTVQAVRWDGPVGGDGRVDDAGGACSNASSTKTAKEFFTVMSPNVPNSTSFGMDFNGPTQRRKYGRVFFSRSSKQAGVKFTPEAGTLHRCSKNR